MDGELRGVLPVVQMPYHEDESVDHETLAQEVRWALDQGVDGITIAMVSEYLRLTDEERIAVSRTAIDAADGRPVIVSVGAESTVAALRLATRAEELGAAAVMAIPPLSVGAPEAEIRRYYEALLGAVTIPVIVQDASGYVGKELSIDVQASLLDRFGPRVLFKPEADPIGPRLTALREATGGQARVFEGSGGIALVDSHRRGIVGTMPAADVCWAIAALWHALEAGDDDAAYAISGPLASLISMQKTLDSFIAIEKHLLVRQGIFRSDRVRGPVGFRIDQETRDEADRLFERLTQAVRSVGTVPGQG